MKRIIRLFIVLIMVSGATTSFAQNDRKDFFNSNEILITWLGIDYSKTKYIGDPGTVDASEMRDNFNKINHLIIAESDKYDVKAAFKKNDFNMEIGYILDRNNAVDMDRIIGKSNREVYRFTKDSIYQIIKSYDLPKELTGLGVVFVCEAIDKNTEKSTFYVTCFNIQSKEILFTEKVLGSAGGFGFRNHWARCVYDVLNDIKSNLFKTWKKKYESVN